MAARWGPRSGRSMKALSLLQILLVLLLAAPAHADARDRAKRMYDRLVGVPPSEAQLADMVARIGPNPTHAQLFDAAMVAIRVARLLQRLAGQLRHAVDQRRADRVRRSERLHRHGDRDDPRRRPVRPGAHAPTSSTSPRPGSCRRPISRRAISTTSRSSRRASTSRIRRSSSACRSRRCRARRSARPTPRASSRRAPRPRRSSARAPTAACGASPR